MQEIILATSNQHKKKELTEIFNNKINFKTLNEIGFNDKIIENGKTFIENSLIKCRAVFNAIKKPVMADDSGLCVKTLHGEPGIFSARYGGKGLTDKQRYEYLLKNIKEKDDLSASFICALVLYINPNNIYIVQEEVKGEITFEPRGNNGFGYDPVFFIPEFGKTAAELTNDEKNSISHRGKAAKMMKKIIDNVAF